MHPSRHCARVCRRRAWWSRAHSPRMHHGSYPIFVHALQAASGHRPDPSPGTNSPPDCLCPGSAPRFRLGLPPHPASRRRTCPSTNLRLCCYLVPGLSPGGIRAMHGTHVGIVRRAAGVSARMTCWASRSLLRHKSNLQLTAHCRSIALKCCQRRSVLTGCLQP